MKSKKIQKNKSKYIYTAIVFLCMVLIALVYLQKKLDKKPIQYMSYPPSVYESIPPEIPSTTPDPREKVVEYYAYNEVGTYSRTISGLLSYPSEGIPPGKIIAKNIVTSEVYSMEYPGTGIAGQAYSIQIPPGRYYMKFVVEEYNTVGYYTAYSLCMHTSECDQNNHELIVVDVTETIEVNNVNLNDFYAKRELF